MRDETLDDYLERNNLFLCRELTDEEIWSEVLKTLGKFALGREDVLAFAKAILKKARET